MVAPENKMTRHEFLTEVHLLVEPETYLEVGVQRGDSLALARRAKLAIGIDPEPLVASYGSQVIYSATADDYFTYLAEPEMKIDFAFIDGSHLFEDALRDFINIEKHSHPGTVVVFDDVLPYNDDVGGRRLVPGHWAGDVWKIEPILTWVRANTGLHHLLVDTDPTGTMLVWGLDSNHQELALSYAGIRDTYLSVVRVPDSVITRAAAVTPGFALEMLAAWQRERVLA